MVVTFAVEPFEVHLDEPLVTASGTIDVRRGVLIRHGRGVGEATPLPPWTEPYDAMLGHLTAVAENALSPGAALARVAEAPAARHGVALALADDCARQRGCSLTTLLGGTPMASIPVNATLDAASTAELADAARDAASAGYRSIKLKLGRESLGADLDRVAAVAAATPDGVDLRLDANAAFDRMTASELASRLPAARVDYVEQPTPGVDHETIAAFEAAGIAVAIDEGVHRDGAPAVFRSDAHAIVLKPMALGGIDVARGIARAARSLGIKPVVSDLVTGAVARTAAAHLAASLGEPEPAGLDTGWRLRADLVSDPPVVEGGQLKLPTGPGLGLTEVRPPDG